MKVELDFWAADLHLMQGKVNIIITFNSKPFKFNLCIACKSLCRVRN